MYMNKQEFLDRIKTQNIPTDAQYKEVEFVYTWHPSIDEVSGKSQIASLWDIGGIRLIRDMMPTARKAQELEQQIQNTQLQLTNLRSMLANLKAGGIGKVDD